MSMAEPTMDLVIPVDVPNEVAERAYRRWKKADENVPFEEFLIDHLDHTYEWNVSDELLEADFLRC